MAILYYHSLTSKVQRLASLVERIGVQVTPISLNGARSPVDVNVGLARDEEGCLLMDLGDLPREWRDDELRQLRAHFEETGTTVMLVVTEVTSLTVQVLQVMTKGAIIGIEPVKLPEDVTFPESGRPLSCELATYSYPRRADETPGFVMSPAESAQTIMMLGNLPTFVRIRVGKANIFVWITKNVFDVLCPLATELEFEQMLDQYIPLIIFLRFAVREQCWHNPSPTAGFVIDDPLLDKKYGFINFRQLLESARRKGYQVTLAFIPWNYWRSRASAAQMFRSYSDCFHVCAHGCDHTKRELRSTDYEELLNKSFVARRRMERLRDRTGIQTDAIMICPQEQYSLAAMRAFADSRQFMGLVCTACMPQDLESPAITGADLLLPAQDSLYGFPVFKRHYAGDMSVFAMSLFLGKPAILVEHHGFFRDGIAGVEEFVQQLSRTRTDLRWASLFDVVTRAHVRRRIDSKQWELRFFSDVFQLEHQAEECTEYRLIRRVPEAARLERALVNGTEIPFTRSDGFIEFHVDASHPQTFSVQLEFTIVKPTKVYSPGLRYSAAVAVRRGLSEFRDNVIARNRLIHRSCNRLIKVLGWTGG